MRFHISTFGCQMNIRDSQWLTQALLARGHAESEPEKADIVFLNTCSVREKPERKVKTVIEQTVRKCGDKALIGVLGCVAQQLGEGLFELAPQVVLVAGGENIGKVPLALETLLEQGGRICLCDFSEAYAEKPAYAEALPSRSVFVNIMQGCDNYCSYCIVPFTRGRQKSRRLDAIIAECAEWIGKGALEITLLGQNVNAWGKDAEYRDGAFTDLLTEIAALSGLRRLHFLSPHPRDFKEDTIACFADLPKLCPRVHLPLQAGADSILKAMHRGYSRENFMSIIRALREARPDIAISTDLIAGFPGESEKEFDETLEMMEACGFISSYTYCYSDRPGTRSVKMSGKIPDDIKVARVARLQGLQDSLTFSWLTSRIGEEAEILVERPSARDPGNSWLGKDIYGTGINVILEGGQDHRGRLVRTLITQAKKHSLIGQAIL